jgi:hypothetical protein
VLDVWQLGHVVHLLGISVDPPLHDMRLQPHSEISCAHAGIDDCQDDQDNRDGGKTRQTLPNGDVVEFVAGLVHSGHLEDEVCQSTEKEEDCDNHAKLVLTAGPEGCHEKNDDRYRDGGDREAKFGSC